jgi:hypothetical protein
MRPLLFSTARYSALKEVAGSGGVSNRLKARVFRRDSPPTRSRSMGSGGESSSMLTSVQENAVQGRMLL